ncbi:hypothetical protein [Baekduia sp. Peel2402]|uniref:hypothetical protein n=1 Tax=Baekduia sp. Peel2402 TaxID=3458296 RepID=UPI00403E9FE8
MESDVNTTLSELERKLKELERELESVGRGGELDSEPAQAGWNGAPEPVEAPPLRGPAPPPFTPAFASPPPPPPPGATPLTAVWHGGATPGPPPVEGEPVRVAPPPAPHAFVQHAAPAPPPPPQPALHQQLDELIAFRDRLVRTTDDLVSELSRVLNELGVAAPAPPPPPPDPANTPLSGDVVLEAATFADLATLAGLEQALHATAGVADVYVRALDQGRATIDVRLSGAVALGAALRAVWPVPFQVTAAADGHLSIVL